VNFPQGVVIMGWLKSIVFPLILSLSWSDWSVAADPDPGALDDTQAVTDSPAEKVPTWTVTRAQIENMEIASIGHMMVLLQSKLPLPDGETTLAQIIGQISGTGNEIIHFHQDFIVVRSFGTDEATGQRRPLLLVKYQFDDDGLVRGPVILNPGVIKDLKFTGKKVK